MSRRALLATVALVAGLLVACGGGGPSMDGDAAASVHAQVTAVRDSVMARDADGADRALASLRASVARLQRSGQMTDEKAAEILAAARAVQTRLVSITTTTTTTTTTLPPAPTTKPGKGPKPEHDDEKKGPH